MGLLDQLLGRGEKVPIVVRDGMCVIRRRDLTQYLARPREPNFAEVGPRTCDRCSKPMPELLLTTGGPLGDKDVWRDAPIVVDGWACVECGVFHLPRKTEPAQIAAFGDEGAKCGQAGRFAEAEWWFTRMVWDWPGYVPGHVNLAEATRERLFRSRDLDEGTRRMLRERMRAEYEAAVDGYLAKPSSPLVPAIARAQLTLADLAIEDHAFDRARRAAQGCLELEGIDAASIDRARSLVRYVDERLDLFESASGTLRPYLSLVDRPGAPVDSPDKRAAIVRAIEDLEQHCRIAPHRWEAAWMIAKGRSALGDPADPLTAWRAAWTAHPDAVEVVREAALALLSADCVAEAREINRDATTRMPGDATLWCNRAVTELLTGEIAQARRCIDTSRRLDPADPIARAVEERVGRCERGAPEPRTLRELSRT
jgi:hypothetical protein